MNKDLNREIQEINNKILNMYSSMDICFEDYSKEMSLYFKDKDITDFNTELIDDKLYISYKIDFYYTSSYISFEIY